jgi:hypothetical protein
MFKTFEILNFGHWDLFVIWDLGFGIWDLTNFIPEEKIRLNQSEI